MEDRAPFARLWLVCWLQLFLAESDLATGIYALVTLRQHYCHKLCLGMPLKSIWKLQLIQSILSWLLVGTNDQEHMTSYYTNYIGYQSDPKSNQSVGFFLHSFRVGYLKYCFVCLFFQCIHCFLPGKQDSGWLFFHIFSMGNKITERGLPDYLINQGSSSGRYMREGLWWSPDNYGMTSPHS